MIGKLINQTGCKTIIVNGVEDHIHCFFGLKPSLSVSEVMRPVKAKSSKWINNRRFLPHRFEWQPGYGVFSYCHSHMNAVYQYIDDQENRHKRKTFREEYINMLEKFEIDYDEQYIFHELI